jgi:hemolysin activation/secretion protein/AraC-like DNA-binding protein
LAIESAARAGGAKLQRAGALQDAGAHARVAAGRASVWECGGPPPLFTATAADATKIKTHCQHFPPGARPQFSDTQAAEMLRNCHLTETRRAHASGNLCGTMAVERHLILQELTLRPSGEWSPPAPGWTVVRVAEGMGYWLQGGGARELKPGDGFVATEISHLVVRASQLGPLKLEYFCVQPQFLNGLITVMEGHKLEAAEKNLAARAIFFEAAEPIAQKFMRLVAQPRHESLMLRSALLQLWSQAVAGVLATTTVDESGHHLRERFRQLVAEMPDAELATHSLPELAEQLHCSERHFSRLFRAEFGVPLRKRQTELRLQRARQLLADANAKIINVAYESGYRHLGLFNAMFKKRFGVTPSEWRQQNVPAAPAKSLPRRPGAALVAWLLLATVLLAPHLRADTAVQAQARAALQAKLSALGDTPSTPPPAPAPVPFIPTNSAVAAAALMAAVKKDSSTNAGPRFTVNKYLVAGNTVLPPASLGHVFTNVPEAFGTNVSFADIRSALGELQMAYRERGFVTVSVALPPQKLTNATVQIKVTEGRLSAINVKGNKYFSTDNVLRALPSLHTNMLLNSHVFQRELDTANASRDRQIYPVISPGFDPGTSELELKVKDTLPLHVREEINNQTTPGTPDSRLSTSAQYDNLWQLEHQIGVNYSFSPVNYKDHSNYYFWPLDYPQVANYSGYYRMPLGPVVDVESQVDSSLGKFGYSEITHQFSLPPPSGRPELNVYASRSISDTGIKNSPLTSITNTPLFSIDQQQAGENITLNQGFGGKFTLPLPPLGNMASSVSFGMDLKQYQNASYNTNLYYFTTRYTNNGVPVTNLSTLATGQTPQNSYVEYFPINVGISGSMPDPWGSTTFNAQANYNIACIGSLSQLAYCAGYYSISTNSHNQTVTNSLNTAKNNYYTVTAGATREQRIYKDWTALIHADGQWASCPLFSNEQYAMGGSAGVRGYQEGEVYGDAGWRMSVEPRTPMINIGMVDGDVPFWVRASVFMDYGQTYLLQQTPSNHTSESFWGYGASLVANIGSHMDGRLTIAFPLISSALTPAESVQVYFGVGAQF